MYVDYCTMNPIRCKYLILTFLLLPLLLQAKGTPADSLKLLFTRIANPEKRVEIRINIDEYYYNNDLNYNPITARQLLSEAVKVKNEYGIVKALRHLVMGVNKEERVITNDSVAHYIKLAETYLSKEWKDCLIAEIRIRGLRCMIDWDTDEEKIVSTIMNQYTDSIKNQNDIYAQIEREYAFGKSYSSIRSEWNENLAQSVYHFDRLRSLIKQLPIKAKASIFLCVYDNLFVGYFNAGARHKAIEMLEELKETIVEYQTLPAVRKDVFQDFNEAYYIYYIGMAYCPDIIGAAKAYAALKQVEKLSLLPYNDQLSLYNAYKEYYYHLGDIPKAILYADTFIKIIESSKQLETSAAVSLTYKEQAKWYAELKDYKNAYESILKYDNIKDSLVNKETKKVREEMNVRYGVNQLEFEKLQLESRNRRIGIISIFLVLVLSTIWGITQRINLKKLQKMQKNLVESNKEVTRQSLKAQESEKMKSAFINSMCHEIRTPLNSINGFSSLLLDPSVENELKKDFPELIQKNSDQLTRLINDLLEVASLDSSVERVPMELTDINAILSRELKKLISEDKKAKIDYMLDLPQENTVILSQPTYITRIIANLLNNANKFTEQGRIVLSCRKDEEKHVLLITLTDTGIGIPKDKLDWIFERFTKIDDFKPGTGLGLYVCRLMMKRLGGKIKVDSQYTQGARFILTLPL